MHLAVIRSTALCWFGNEHLAAPDEGRLAEVSLKSCFKGVERLEFVRPSAHQFAAPGAAFVLGTKTWFRRLKADGVESIRLHLPLSLMEPFPSAYGVVTDSPLGSDIWVAAKQSGRNLEYAAQRFAAWSVPRPSPASDISAELAAVAARLAADLASSESDIGNRVAKLAGYLRGGSFGAEGFEDCIPSEFSADWRRLASQAIRTVVLLGAGAAGMETSSPVNERVDALWKLGLRLLEAIGAEVFAERNPIAA